MKASDAVTLEYRLRDLLASPAKLTTMRQGCKTRPRTCSTRHQLARCFERWRESLKRAAHFAVTRHAFLLGACASPTGIRFAAIGPHRIGRRLARSDFPLSSAILDRAQPHNAVAFTNRARRLTRGSTPCRDQLWQQCAPPRAAWTAPRCLRRYRRRTGAAIDGAGILGAYPSAAQTVEGLKRGEGTLRFFAIDPARANEARVHCAIPVHRWRVRAVPTPNAFARVEQIDQPGVRGGGPGQCVRFYTLSRTLKRAALVRVKTSPVVADELIKRRL